MNRRSLLRLLLSTPIALTLDVEKLLWVPGEKTIFLPAKRVLTESQIIAAELERILSKVPTLFERDNTFFGILEGKAVIAIHKTISMSIPLQRQLSGGWT